MIYKSNGSRYYFAKFRWQGKLIRKSTRCTNRNDARVVEGQIRAELGKGNWGILTAKPRLTLDEFLGNDFLPYIESKFQSTPKTRSYYAYGVKSLLASDLAKLRLDEITGQHTQQYAARFSVSLKPATINCGLRTLRRALALGEEWGKLTRSPKISLVKGERQRERVLSDDEYRAYLEACPQPWRDVVLLIWNEGMRPGECFALRWENILFTDNGGLIQIVQGKSKAARRMLPMMPEVYHTLKSRQAAQGGPLQGWIFPNVSFSGHIEGGSGKQLHKRALLASGVKPFEPYCLRHSFATRMSLKCDVFSLARILGHSSIGITQRYCHPQGDAIAQAFVRLAEGHALVTDGGHSGKRGSDASGKEEFLSLLISVK